MKKPKPMSVDEMTAFVALKFPSDVDHKSYRGRCVVWNTFVHGVSIREVVLFVRKLARRRK